MAATLILLFPYCARHLGEEGGLDRYCKERDTIQRQLMPLLAPSDRHHAPDDSRELRRQQIAAARLLYLIPRSGNEAVSDYLQRVESRLQHHCS